MADSSAAAVLIVENDADSRGIYVDILTPLVGRLLEAGNPYEAFTF